MSSESRTALQQLNPLSRLDLSAKFTIAIVTSLFVLFSIGSYFMLRQNGSAIDHLLQAAGEEMVSIVDKQKKDEKVDQGIKLKQLTELLAAIAPGPIAEYEMSALAQYAKVVTGDKDVSYVAFMDKDGNVLSSAGSMDEVDPGNTLETDVVAEGIVLGRVIVGYNHDRLDLLLGSAKKRHDKMLAEMQASRDQSLTESTISMGIIMVLIAATTALITYLMFRAIVVKRLCSLLGRFRDIAEGDGDLRQRITVSGNDGIDRLGHYFNMFIAKIHQTMNEVASATHQLGAASDEMAQVTSETDQAIRTQQLETDQLATAINEFVATSQEVARNATNAAESANKADADASSGKAVVLKTVGAIRDLATDVEQAASVIQRLQDDSESIGSILNVIRGIAEQTNLLALNAAIEAARAGEQGRGFAVVADEVRTLASRTQKSTQEIQDMIERLQSGAEEAVNVMQHSRGRAQDSVEQAAGAGESLEGITAAVTNISDMNNQIATAAEEQNSVAEEINRNIHNITLVAEKTASGAHRTSKSSDDLKVLSSGLHKLIQGYKL